MTFPKFTLAALLTIACSLNAGTQWSDAFESVALCGLPSEIDEDEKTSAPNREKLELLLEIPGSLKKNKPVKAKVRIKNLGQASVSLVLPGDGSECHWRTPIVGWSILPVDSIAEHPKTPPLSCGGRCGNINRLKPEEVFTLKPNEAKEFSEWLGFPTPRSAGKFRVVFYYSNVPDMKWSGVPLGQHDADAMRRLKKGTKIAMKSNEVLMEVVD